MRTGRHQDQAIVLGLVWAVILWGANNTGMKFLLGFWPPIGLGCVRFLCAGLLLWWWQVARGDQASTPLPNRAERQAFWWRTGATLAAYIVVFNWALMLSSVAHVALYLGAAPLWALLLDRHQPKGWLRIKRWGAAGLALVGVFVLFWPGLRWGHGSWIGELLGLGASALWAFHGRECRRLGHRLSASQITAQTMWRAGVWLLPLAVLESIPRSLMLRWDGALVFLYTILGGGVLAFVLWNRALTQWPISRVFLFNNLIPLSSMLWAHVCLHEPLTPRFLLATALILGAVILAQTNWERLLGPRWLPSE